MTDTSKSFVLPENFRPTDDGSLQEFLRANAGFAVRIDAGKLRKLDSILIELLLCAAKAWRAKHLSFEVRDLSRANEEILMYLGLKSDHLIWRAAA